MNVADLGPLGWPSPLLDPSLQIDPYAAVELDGDGLAIRLESGARVRGRCTIPAAGVLRLRIAERDRSPGAAGPLLVPFDDRPAELRRDGDTVHVTGPGVDAVWNRRAGFSMGPFRRGPEIGVIGRGLAAAGRLVDLDGRTAGWMETAHLRPQEPVFGGGESFQGPDLRGRVRRLRNVEAHGASGLDYSYLNVPFFWSPAGWGVFLHTAAPARADLGATHSELAAFAVEGDELDLFIITGSSPTAILQRYLQLTGRPGPFPDWALGVWTSRCSYLSEAELHEVVDGYEKAGCPVDVAHVDAWVEGNVVADLCCNWTVDRERFPAGWSARLAERGVRVSLWHNPYVLEGSAIARQLHDAGFLVRTTDGRPARTPDKTDRFLLDFTNDEAVAWWKDRVRNTVAAEGNVSFKPDFAEELPEDAVLADGRTGRQARNEYAVRYQAATHEAMVDALGTDEIALFCRSGTAGAQRYPCHWVGDTPSTWDGLVTALRACLSLSLSGFALVSHDIGGFWTGGSHGWVAEAFAVMDNRDIPADVEPELFARWAQWGALSPVMRFHGTGRREPWAYPDPWGPAAVEACRWRESLRPYLAAAARDAHAEGTPMMRPMVLEHPDDPAALAAALQYLLGPDLLVAPVLEPGGRRRVWIPPGRWAPFAGLEAVEGPAWVDVECEARQFPAWWREGAGS